MKRYHNRKPLWSVVFVAMLLTVVSFAVPAFAAEGAEGPSPWDDVVVTFGLVTLAWSQVQMGFINLLKGITYNGEPLLNSRERIWLANAVLGVIGLTLSYLQGGSSLLAAAVQAILVVVLASGGFELGQLGKKSSSPVSEPHNGPAG